MPSPASNKLNPVSGYQIARPQGQCALTGRTIQPDERFMTALRQSPQGLERLDISMDAWQGFDTSSLLGFWQTTMPRPEEKKQIFLDDDILLELFERLADAAEAQKIDFRFVLGLILMRKRLVIYESTRRDGEAEIWIVRLKGRDQRQELLNPNLDEQQIAEVSRQLSDILSGEL